MNILEKLTIFVTRVFKTNLEIFLSALKLSPNAQGYVGGSVTELLLKQKLENEYGFEVKRIKEKWEGKKHQNHYGDFYIRKSDSENWFVIESKGVKSNSEKWHKLYNLDNLKKFLINNEEKINFINHDLPIEEQVATWINKNLPRFYTDYKEPLYEFEEVHNYLDNLPKKETQKSKAILNLRGLSREELHAMIQERLLYLSSKIRVLETHFVSGKSDSSDRTQATPRKNEFNIISIDIVLKHHEHKFLFANPQLLESSEDDINHLKQNYIMGFSFVSDGGEPNLNLSEEWCEDFIEVYNSIDQKNHINSEEMQVDFRFDLIDQDTDNNFTDLVEIE